MDARDDGASREDETDEVRDAFAALLRRVHQVVAREHVDGALASSRMRMTDFFGLAIVDVTLLPLPVLVLVRLP